MVNSNSAAETRGSKVAGASAYGCAEYGAPWGEAGSVLIALHGRDRAAGELPGQFLKKANAQRVRVLAPYAVSRSWYDGRFDAPLAENVASRDAGLAHVRAAFAAAHGKGINPAQIVLAGFSQGGCMVVEHLLAGVDLPAAAVIFTGCALDLAHRDRANLPKLGGMPIILSGGCADPWAPVKDLMATGDLLEAAGAHVQTEIFPDGEHLVRDQEMSLLGTLIQGVCA